MAQNERKSRAELVIAIRRLQQALNERIALFPEDLHNLELVKISQELDHCIANLYLEYGNQSNQ